MNLPSNELLLWCKTSRTVLRGTNYVPKNWSVFYRIQLILSFLFITPEKDERGRVKLDVNNLLSLSSLSWTLDGDSGGESSPQVSHHSGQKQSSMDALLQETKEKGPFIEAFTLPTL